MKEKCKGFSQRFVFWSGGKDSTVCLHLALRAWNDFETVFVDTGISLPETLNFIHDLAQEWGVKLTVLKPDTDFWPYVAYAGFPLHKALWCRRLLKMKPIKKFMKSRLGWKVQVLGIRRAESTHRATSPFYKTQFRTHTKLPFTYNLLPILDWSNTQRDQYTRDNEIPVNPCYRLYKTSGCYICPYVRNPRHYLALRRLHPELFARIAEAETTMCKKYPGHTALASLSIQSLAHQTTLAQNHRNGTHHQKTPISSKITPAG